MVYACFVDGELEVHLQRVYTVDDIEGHKNNSDLDVIDYVPIGPHFDVIANKVIINY